MIGIYKITSPTGKIYIGQSVDIKLRWLNYKSTCHKGKLKNSFKSHGIENHTFEILEECTIELLNERERYYQDFYDVLGPNGLNLKLTETTDKSGCISEETRKKLSKISRGKIISEKQKEMISKFHKGKVTSEETRKKMSISRNKVVNSDAHKNRVISEETRRKMSESGKGRVQTEEHRRKNSEGQKRRYQLLREQKLKDKENDN